MKTKPGQITWRSAAGLAAVGSILVSGIGMETRASPSAPSPLITKGRLEQAAPAATMPASTTVADKANQARLIESYGKLPLAFERNQGQTDAHVRFLSRGDGYI